MKRLFNSILILALALTTVTAVSAQLRPPNVYVSSGLIVRYTGGTLYTGTTATTIATGTLTLTGSKASCVFPALTGCDIIYWPGSGTALLFTATPATAFAAGNIVLATATTNTTNVLALTVFNSVAPGSAGPGWNQSNSNYLSDGYYFVPPSACGILPATTAFAAGSPSMKPAATGNLVLSATTDTTAGTLQVVCDLSLPGRTTAGKGYLVTDVSLLYGIQTTNLASIAAAGINTVTYPAIGGAAAGTVAAAGGSLAVLPASLQLTTTTAGQCFNENLAFPTLVAAADKAVLTVNQVFTTAGSAATTLQICGAIVHYFNAPI